MLTLAAYKLETPTLEDNDFSSSWHQIESTINDWMAVKGINESTTRSGTFSSKTPGKKGLFERINISTQSGSLLEITLTEPTSDGHIFKTNLSLTSFDNTIAFYLTLAASNAGDMVAPTSFYPRCPSVIRDILNKRQDWFFGEDKIPSAKEEFLTGEKSADQLAKFLLSSNRSLPVTVVSELDGEPIWKDLPEKLSHDLAGLSSVVRIDADASWALSNLLGKSQSCYLGAVRIYWPSRCPSPNPSDLRSQVWTAERLLSNDSDGKGISRFTTSLRRKIMSVAALSVNAPAQIRKIKAEYTQARLTQLEEQADANSEALELAKLFIEENEKLKDELESAKEEIAKQSARADTAEYAIELLKSDEGNDPEEGKEASKKPLTGDIRYYKKTHSKPSYDVLVKISDCGHNSWQSANKGDKAKKGIERLEGSSDWKNLYHCGSCTGGGVWKVEW